MNIFITGGTGFIGRHLLKRLGKTSHNIFCLKRKDTILKEKFSPNIEWIEGSLDDNFDQIFQNIDIFLHLASHAPNVPYDTIENYLYWNVYASTNLIHQAVNQGVNKFITAGTCFEYGLAANFGDLSSKSPLLPNLSYPTSKAAASITFQGIAEELSLKLKILRIFQVYGEGELSSRLWPSMKEAAKNGTDFSMTDGNVLRDFINVENVARAFEESLNFDDYKDKSEIIHVASGVPMTLKDFAISWWEKWDAKGEIRFGEYPSRPGELKRITSDNESIKYKF